MTGLQDRRDDLELSAVAVRAVTLVAAGTGRVHVEVSSCRVGKLSLRVDVA